MARYSTPSDDDYAKPTTSGFGSWRFDAHETRSRRTPASRPDQTWAEYIATLDWLASPHRVDGRMHQVVDCLDEALAMTLQRDHPTGTAWLFHELGAVMYEAGRYDSAMNYLRRAEQHYNHPRDRPADLRQIEGWLLQGRILRMAGRAHAARRCLQEAAAAPVAGANDEISSLLSAMTTPGATLPGPSTAPVSRFGRALEDRPPPLPHANSSTTRIPCGG
jgi:tetratricopeptide (TPR) repeat protein